MGWFEERSGLKDSVAVVTGGAGGLGEAIALDLAANGVRLALIDISEESVAGLQATFDQAGYDSVVHHGDARDPERLRLLLTAAARRWSRVDILVNVVGGTFQAPFVDTTPKGWDSLLRTNLLHVLHACSLTVPLMRDGGRGGSIINMSTIEAHRAAPGFAVYSAAKAAVEQFGRTLAVELAPLGIRVNNVAPDYAPTPNMSRITGPDFSLSEPLGSSIAIPMGRPGKLTEISSCVVFLASNLSSYLTGTTLHPDGGTLASSGWFNWPATGWASYVPTGILDHLETS